MKSWERDQTNEASDDDAVTIVSLDQEDIPVATGLPERLLATAGTQVSRMPRLHRRQRAITLSILVVLSSLLLIRLVLPDSVASLGGTISGVVQQWFPHAPVTTFSDNLSSTLDQEYYLDVSVPWTQVFIDGVSVHIPVMNSDAPLTLRPGRHFITWLAVPFLTQFCVLTIPDAEGDTCEVASDTILQQTPEIPTQILLLHDGLYTMPSNRETTLLKAAEAALASIQGRQEVQPGEQYIGPTGYTIARQQLEATRHFTLVTAESGYRQYDVDGQLCLQLCIVPWHYVVPPLVEPAAAEAWLAVGYVSSYWDYTTPDGRVVVRDEKAVPSGVGLDAYPVLMRILWTGLTWQVTPLLGVNQAPPIVLNSLVLHHPPTPADKVRLFDDPSCEDAHFLYSTVGSTFANVRFISGSNPATGCLVVVNGGPEQPTPTYYFEHLGVFLAANDAAHKAQPQLPFANAYERTLVAQLLVHA